MVRSTKLHDDLYTFEDIENKATLLDPEICFDVSILLE